MSAFALAAEQAQQLDRPVADAAEPVRDPRIELGGLARMQDEILIAEHQPQLAVQDVEPLIAFVGLRLGVGTAVRDDVASASAARVVSRCRRSARRRGPTAVSTALKSLSMGLVCHYGKFACRECL